MQLMWIDGLCHVHCTHSYCWLKSKRTMRCKLLSEWCFLTRGFGWWKEEVNTLASVSEGSLQKKAIVMRWARVSFPVTLRGPTWHCSKGGQMCFRTSWPLISTWHAPDNWGTQEYLDKELGQCPYVNVGSHTMWLIEWIFKRRVDAIFQAIYICGLFSGHILLLNVFLYAAIASGTWLRPCYFHCLAYAVFIDYTISFIRTYIIMCAKAVRM